MLSRRLPASRVVSAATVASTRSSPTSSTGSGGSLSSSTSSKHSGESLPRAVSNANNTAYRLYHAPQQYHVSDSMSSANQQQQQQQPVLLLTGDELHVSNEGVARSHYQLHTPQNASLTNSCTTWSIEEEYHLYDEAFLQHLKSLICAELLELLSLSWMQLSLLIFQGLEYLLRP